MMRAESPSERLLFTAVENRLAQLDALIAASHAMMDANQRELDAMGRRLFVLQDQLDLLAEWARLRFEDLSRERG